MKVTKVIASLLSQRRLHFVALYWHPTISLSISFQLKRPTRPIEECPSLPTACICKLSFLIALAFGNIFYRMQSLFAWCVSITRRTYILWLDLRAIARLLAFCSIDLWFSNMPMAISGARRAGQARRGDHFLLMTSLRVWDVCVYALISDRRGRNHALMLG